MLVHHHPSAASQIIPGQAHLVLSVDADGVVVLRSFCFGYRDCSYTTQADPLLLAVTVPQLLAELRLQLQLGRHVTVDESAAIAATLRQLASGTTE